MFRTITNLREMRILEFLWPCVKLINNVVNCGKKWFKISIFEF